MVESRARVSEGVKERRRRDATMIDRPNVYMRELQRGSCTFSVSPVLSRCRWRDLQRAVKYNDNKFLRHFDFRGVRCPEYKYQYRARALATRDTSCQR